MLSPNIFLYLFSLPVCLYSLPFPFFLQFPFLKLNDIALICSPTPPETIELNYIFSSLVNGSAIITPGSLLLRTNLKAASPLGC